MTEGKCIAYVIYSWDDMQSDLNLLEGKALYSNDEIVLNELKNLTFQYTATDMTTVNSFFYILVTAS
ncbi:MAG: hypothetical protein IPM74_14085 [Crocinitomicaceae bacterium]|nr:hypothetical protein [Crocinitomicaceae bacterium]